MLTLEQLNKMAEKALKAIKSAISADKKALKEHPYNEYWGGHRNPNVELYISLKEGWIGAKNEKYRLTMVNYTNGRSDDKHIIETDSREDLRIAVRSLLGLLNTLAKTKGWTTLKIVHDESGDRYESKIEYPSKVILCDAPCKEYKALQNYINKYGVTKYRYTTYKTKLGNFELFRSAMGGKRGYLWDEYGERLYLDNFPKRCERFLAELRKYRGTKDTMYCTIGEEKYIDPVDYEYSCKWEVECEGEQRHYIAISIVTPSGKNKHEMKIY